MAHVLRLSLPSREPYTYNLYFGHNLLNQADAVNTLVARLTQVEGLKAPLNLLVVTHLPLWQQHGQVFLQHLQQAGCCVHVRDVPMGEPSKQLQALQNVWQAAQAAGLTRNCAFVAFGGGVLGDLTGFAAATYYRGVPFVQVPTTLLAQIDSSIGGKTGINWGRVKNGVGVFKQPACVIIDPTVLQTLPEREMTAGLAELFKYALIESSCMQHAVNSDLTDLVPKGPTLWQRLQGYANRQALYPDLSDLIEHCCRIKAAVVVHDEFERLGHRALLNLGHTFGHALEADSHYQHYLHGEAVAIGMAWACQLSVQLGLLTQQAWLEIKGVYQRLGLPWQATYPQHTAQTLLGYMHQDKKNESSQQIRLILPTLPLGSVQIVDTLSANVIHQALQAQF